MLLACVLWRVFSFVVCEVRDSAARKLNRGQKKKRKGEGERGEVNDFSPRLPPHRFLFRPRFSFSAAVTLTFRTTKEKKKRNKNCQLLR